MTLRWHETNLETHAARHVLGAPGEDWGSLLPDPQVIEGPRAEAALARCRFRDHPGACPSPTACAGASRRVAGTYRQLTDAEWQFSQRQGLWVEADGRGTTERVGTGPRGIFLATARHDDDTWVAKTAFRDDSGAPNRVRWAVRKLQAFASIGCTGLTVRQLMELQTLMLAPGTPLVRDPHVRAIYEALQQRPAPLEMP